MPELFETIALNGDGLDKAPHPNVPYYIHALEGDFLYRNTQIGTVLLKETKRPPTLGRIGYAGGVFTWKGEKIPGSLISQAHDFFRRIYETHHAEAEVLITMHNTTGAFRLFVPYQRVSHAGVKSVYEPTHVHKDYTVVGTLHSHCDFSAFHSGTDSGDASDMDGIHFTIGHVNADTPEIVVMVAMNGKEFHYKEVTDVANIEFRTETAPAWWDSYVYPASSPSEKPRSLKSITQAHWDEFRGLVQAKPKHTPSKWTPAPQNRQLISHIPTNSQRIQNTWDDEGWDWRKYVYGGYTPQTIDSTRYNRKKHSTNPDIDAINTVLDLAEELAVFNDQDYKGISPADMDEIDFWQVFFSNRMEAVAVVLEELGLKARFSIKPKKGTSK